MTDLPRLRDLEARLERATGPDREVDIEITRIVEPSHPMFKQQPEGSQADFGYGSETRWGWGVVWPSGSSQTAGFPKYSTSIDAADALRERLFPDWLWQLRFTGADYVFTTHKDLLVGEFAEASAKTKCLAILLVTIRALIAREEGR